MNARSQWRNHPLLVDFYKWATVSMGYSTAYADNCCLEAQRFRSWLAHDEGITAAGDITRSLCEKYLAVRMEIPAKGRKDPPRPNTIRSIRNRLHCVAKYLTLVGRLDGSPWVDVKGPRHELRYIAPPTDAQIGEALIASSHIGMSGRLRSRNQAMTYFLAFTGVRTIELIRLNRCDVLNGTAIARHFTVLGKGSKQRVIGVPVEVIEPLEKYLAARNDTDLALFAGQTGDRISHVAVRSVMRELKREINRRGIVTVGTFGAHSLRRWCFSSMVRNGVSLNIIREIGGWSTYTAMEHYIHYGTMEKAAGEHADMNLLPTHNLTQQMLIE